MPPFRITISPSRRAAARIVSDARSGLQRALVIENERRGITQSDIARAIGVHRSVINREMRGQKDIGLGRVGELAWALGRKAVVLFPEAEAAEGQNEPQDIPPPVVVEFEATPNASTSVRGAPSPEIKYELA